MDKKDVNNLLRQTIYDLKTLAMSMDDDISFEEVWAMKNKLKEIYLKRIPEKEAQWEEAFFNVSNV